MKRECGGAPWSRAPRRALVDCLVAVCGCLLMVGFVSGTFLRHVVQIVPLVVVLAFVVRQHHWSAPAASGLFGCWLFFMGLIWLYLAGVQTAFTGNFTPIEIVLTVLIGIACVAGIIAANNVEQAMGRVRRLMIVATFIGLQLAVMWLSLYGYGFFRLIGMDQA